jgi:hypothetical protein
MNKLPELKDVLQIYTQETNGQVHLVSTEQDTSEEVKNIIFDILVNFSKLEEQVESFLYSLYEDKVDTVGILETEGFVFSKKINLLKRKLNLFEKNTEYKIKRDDFNTAIKGLTGSSQIRNTMAHIKWNSLFEFDAFDNEKNENIDYAMYFYKYSLDKDYDLKGNYVNCHKAKLIEMCKYIKCSFVLFDKIRKEYDIFKHEKKYS